MADDIPISAGVGTDIATDDVGGRHFQRIKLNSSEADVDEPIGDDDKGASRALWVAPRPDLRTQQVVSSGLTTASTAYTAGDVVGAGWTFTDMARESGGGGKVTGIVVVDEADVVDSLTLFFFSESVTFGTDNAAPSISDADAIKCVGVVPVGFVDVGTARLGTVDTLQMPYFCAATSLFVYAVTNVGHTFFAAVDDLVVRLFASRD
jgi:hypothetical protein